MWLQFNNIHVHVLTKILYSPRYKIMSANVGWYPTKYTWCDKYALVSWKSKKTNRVSCDDDHLKQLLVHLFWCKSKEMNLASIMVIFSSKLTHPENCRHIFFLKASIHLSYSVFQPLVNSSSLLCCGAWMGNFLI